MATNLSLALYQPDIPQNTGTLLRLGACLNVDIHIIEPAGFNLTDRNLRRSGMDYLDLASLTRHASWNSFLQWRENRRLLLMTTRGATAFQEFTFRADDIVLMGRESAGVPEAVHETVDERLIIPMRQSARSLNMAISASMVVSEALRQLDAFARVRTH